MQLTLEFRSLLRMLWPACSVCNAQDDDRLLQATIRARYHISVRDSLHQVLDHSLLPSHILCAADQKAFTGPWHYRWSLVLRSGGDYQIDLSNYHS